MKKILELVVCFIHPVAVVLMWINLVSRKDLSDPASSRGACSGFPPTAAALDKYALRAHSAIPSSKS